ncbi:hypothetical protein ACK2GQ_22495 [Clostridioides difficile]
MMKFLLPLVELKTYSNIDMYSARSSSFTVTYHYSYYKVAGDKTMLSTLLRL